MFSLSALKHDLKIIQLRQFKTMQDNFNQRIKTMFAYVIQFRQKNANLKQRPSTFERGNLLYDYIYTF